MKNEFNFKGCHYSAEGELAIKLHENFGDAINYIFSDEFANSFSDSYLRGRVLVELKRCKYAESALTMIIYLLNPSIGLSIRGKSFKCLSDLAFYMHVDDEMHDTIVHLFMDHGITHSLALTENLDDISRVKLMDIENNIMDPAVYKLFVYLYNVNFSNDDYHGLTKLDYYMYDVSSAADPFLTYYKVITNPSFKADLLKNDDIKKVLACYENPDMPFMILKDILPILKLDIKNILGSGMHYWLAANLDLYVAKGFAKKVFKAILKLEKEAKKPATVNTKVNNDNKMYRYYLLVVRLWDLGLVMTHDKRILKRMGNVDDYELNLENIFRVTRAYNNETKVTGEVTNIAPKAIDVKARKILLEDIKKEFKEIKRK